MATKLNIDNTSLIAENLIIVEGYVRMNFADNCWINQIIQIIVQFYMSIGGSLYVFGNGDDGCLGLEEFEDIICKVPTICPPFNECNVLDAWASRITFILDTDGQVWSFGEGRYAQLGNGEMDNVYIPQKLDFKQAVIAMAAGGEHSLILFDNGTVQSFGYGDHGQLGLRDVNDDPELIPQTIDALKNHKIVQIAAGYGHSVCLSEKGIVFCFGGNHKGQCGVGKDKGIEVRTPTQVKLDDVMVFIDCGDEHTLLISGKGHIYACGNNCYGQLGHGDDELEKFTPALIETFGCEEIIKCAAGESHSLCIDEVGDVYAFGKNALCQCGLPSDIYEIYEPMKIDYFASNNIKAVNCYAADHGSAIISENGSLYVFGDNRKHQLGLAEPRHYQTPQRLQLPQNETVVKIAMGYEYTVVITK